MRFIVRKRERIVRGTRTMQIEYLSNAQTSIIYICMYNTSHKYTKTHQRDKKAARQSWRTTSVEENLKQDKTKNVKIICQLSTSIGNSIRISYKHTVNEIRLRFLSDWYLRTLNAKVVEQKKMSGNSKYLTKLGNKYFIRLLLQNHSWKKNPQSFNRPNIIVSRAPLLYVFSCRIPLKAVRNMRLGYPADSITSVIFK